MVKKRVLNTTVLSLLAFLSLCLLHPSRSLCAAPKLLDGDIIFQTSRSAQSEAIQQATRSRYSHMGLIFLRDGHPFVLEAVSTVRDTPLSEWIARGKDQHFVVYRLNKSRALSPEDSARLRKVGESLIGKPYDLTFEWSDERIYCSELVWKVYNKALGLKLGALARLKDFNLDAPAVRKKMKERYGNHPPYDEIVISPEAILSSPLLARIE